MMHQETVILIAVSVVLPTFASIAILLRVVAKSAKCSLRNALDASDYLAFVSLVFAWAISATTICGAKLANLGGYVWEENEEDDVNLLKIMFALQLLYLFSVSFVKLSVASLYRNIFTTRRFRLACDIYSGIVVAWLVALMLAILLRHTPISLNWDLENWNNSTFILYSIVGAIDIILDIVILSFPVFVIRRLHMAPERKWQVAGMFSLGGLCVIASPIRFAYVIRAVIRAFVTYIPDASITLDSSEPIINVNNFIWTIEPSTSIIAACLPTYANLFRGPWTASTSRRIRSNFAIGRSQKHGSDSAYLPTEPYENASYLELAPTDARVRGIADGKHQTHVAAACGRSKDSTSHFEDAASIHVAKTVDVSSEPWFPE